MDAAIETRRTIDAVFRIEAPRLIAGLTRMVRDVGLAEELAQDALVTALSQWPESGVPRNPGAWLMTAAKRRGIDLIRRQRMAQRKHEAVGYDMEMEQESAVEALEESLDAPDGDDLLNLMFAACHPVLSTEARLALTLRLVGGLTTEEIAHAFLVPEPTMAQRIVRAKRTLSEARIEFEIPRGSERDARLASVRDVIYLIFNEGYSATTGKDWIRPQLAEDALRLGRMLAELAPDEPEVHGLVALMEIQQSRLKARVDAEGEPILLADQDRSRWDHLLIRRGLAALDRIAALDGLAGPMALQAAIAACHARAPTTEATDWPTIAALYAALMRVTPSPVIELNRAVAVSMAEGPAAGLAIADRLVDEPALKSYHLVPTVRANLLKRLGRMGEAQAEFERAAGMARSERERKILLKEAETCVN